DPELRVAQRLHGLRGTFEVDLRRVLAAREVERDLTGRTVYHDARLGVAGHAPATVARFDLEPERLDLARRHTSAQAERLPEELVDLGIRRARALTVGAAQVFVVNPVLHHVRER